MPDQEWMFEVEPTDKESAEELTFDDEGDFVDEEEFTEDDETIYDDFGPEGAGSGMPAAGYGVPSYYGGGGGGGGGGYYEPPQLPQPAATVTPLPTPQPVDPGPGPEAVPLPPDTPKSIVKFAEKAKQGRLTPEIVKAAAADAKSRGQDKTAGKIVDIGRKQGALPPKKPGPPPRQPAKPPAQKAAPPRQAPSRRAPARRLRGLEDEMSTTVISDIDLMDVESLDDLAALGQDEMILDDAAMAEEGEIPGFEIDDSGQYMTEDEIEPMSPVEMAPYEERQSQMVREPYQPMWSPSQAGYGYDPYQAMMQQQMMQQSPYGMSPYGASPYGYDPYAQQQYGYGARCPDGSMPTGVDPYTGQPMCGGYAQRDASGLFPAGTPQTIIDAANAILNGTATLEVVQAAVQQATQMGYQTLANQLIAMYQQYGGQWTPGSAGASAGGRYCAQGEDPATTGCTPKAPTGVTGSSFGPLPADPQSCKAEAQSIFASAQFKAAQNAFVAKKPMNAEQRAYFARYTQLMKCAGQPWQTGAVTGPIPTDPESCKAEMQQMVASADFKAAQKAKGNATAAQKQLIVRYYALAKCAGMTSVQANTTTKKKLAMNVMLTVIRGIGQTCNKRDSKGKCKDKAVNNATKNWSKCIKATTDGPVTPEVVTSTMQAAKDFVAYWQGGRRDTNVPTAFVAALKRAGIYAC